MIIIAILIFGLLITVGGFFLNAYIFNWVTKLFKVSNANYKTAIRISLFQLIYGVMAAIIISIIFSLVKIQSLSNIFLAIIGAYILHKLLVKYYQTNLKKNIAIYISYTIVIIIISTITALFIILPIRKYVVRPFYVKGAAMDPNFVDNEYMLFKMWDKNFKRSEVVIFKYPRNSQEYFLKRIVGLPGEKIQMKDGNVYIINSANPNGFKLDEPYLQPDMKTYSIDEEIINLKKDEYYVLGDNRMASKDSRSFGPVNKSFMVGKYWLSPMK